MEVWACLMQNQDQTLVSAEVVLKPGFIIAANEVVHEFTRAGFTVGPIVANNFSISAPVSTFESYFHVKLESVQGAGIRVRKAKQPPVTELPASALPASVRDKVEAILFSTPPDFGPTGSF